MEPATITAILKVVFMILFFAIVTIVGTLPIRSKTFKSNPKLRMIGSTFAGALFINVAILHILPESADTLE
jgi:solute carrier family 39 (zinc transporter), member 1/2/3